jgi:DNA primase
MARKKSYNDNFADLVARLNAMSNMTPEQERKSLMEAASAEPKLLDEKDVSLADIAKLAGIKEYVEPIKVSRKAQKMVENITQPQSDIAKAIKEADADDSIATGIKRAVTEESKRLDKIAELETQLAELKSQEKEEATLDDKSFRERFVSEITEYVKKAEGTELADLYNKFSMNEVELQEKNFLIKTPETKEVIADAEAKEAEAEAEVVQEKEPKAEEPVVEVPAEEPAVEQPAVEEPAVETPEIPVGTEDPQVEIPTKDKFTNDLDPAPKADKK